MDSIRLTVGDKEIKVTNKSVIFDGKEYFYNKMSEVAKVDEAMLPGYEFLYDGEKKTLFYDPKDERIVEHVFNQVVELEKKRVPEVGELKIESETIKKPDNEKNNKDKKIMAVCGGVVAVIIIVILVLTLSGGKPGDLSDEHYDAAISAVETIDKYLDGAISKDGAYEKVNEMKYKFENADGTASSITASLYLISTDLSGDISDKTIKEDRDELASLINY